MKIILTSLAACLVLTACGTPDFDHPAPGSIIVDYTFRPVLHEVFYSEKDLAAFCFQNRGIATQDRHACVVPHYWGHCAQVMRPGDTKHLHEMNAICNGWRRSLVVAF